MLLNVAYYILYSLSLIGILVVSALVIVRRREAEYKNFVFFALLLDVWLALQMYAQLFSDSNMADIPLLMRLATAIGPFFAVFFFFFATQHVNKAFKMKFHFIAPALLALVGVFTDLTVRNASASIAGIVIEDGPLYTVAFAFEVIYLLVAIGYIVKSVYGRSRLNLPQRQGNIILTVAILQALLIISGAIIFLPQEPLAQVLIPLSLFIMVLIIGYAIIRHRLFDIRLVAVRTLAYFFSLVSLAAIYAFLAFGLVNILYGGQDSFARQVFYLAIALLLALTFGPLKVFFDNATDRFFYRRDYTPQQVLAQLGEITANEINLRHLSTNVISLLYSTVKPEFVCIHILPHRSQEERKFHVGRSFNLFGKTLRRSLDRLGGKVIFNDYLDEQYESLQSQLNRAGTSIVVRLETSRERVGYLVLGMKRSGSVYSSKDEAFFRSIGNELALAIQNSLRFEEIQEFNETLQQKIDTATERLRNTNRKLRQLDATKDEFVSMASHQLRTPLTSVKGYLSMVLEGDAGKLNPAQEKLLKEAYQSSERMVRLISDFLNVSRLRTGKFVIERSLVNLASLIDGEISQLEATAATRELTLRFHKPSDFPVLRLDKGKIQQVIMNFIDNAIFYSKPGGEITIELIKKEGEIIFRVKDHGIGVPASEKKQLFTKFFRASNARKQRPDGTGIGLFMAQKIVLAHGGVIIFESHEGKGSTFGFRIPTHQPEGRESKRLG